MHSPLPADALAQARAQYGLLTRAQLDDAKVSTRHRTYLFEGRFLVPVHKGVYRLGSHDVGFEQTCLAACLASAALVVSGPSAGTLHKLRNMPTGSVHLLASTRRVRLSGVVIHLTSVLTKSDWTSRDDGIRVLRSVRLAADLARLDSDLEVRLFRALAEHDVVLEPQVSIDLGGGRALHLDGADRARRFGVEVDHVTWHGGRLAAQRDKWRDRQLLRIDWVVARVTDEDLQRRFASTVADLVEIYRLRRAA